MIYYDKSTLLIQKISFKKLTIWYSWHLLFFSLGQKRKQICYEASASPVCTQLRGKHVILKDLLVQSFIKHTFLIVHAAREKDF